MCRLQLQLRRGRSARRSLSPNWSCARNPVQRVQSCSRHSPRGSRPNLRPGGLRGVSLSVRRSSCCGCGIRSRSLGPRGARCGSLRVARPRWGCASRSVRGRRSDGTCGHPVRRQRGAPIPSRARDATRSGTCRCTSGAVGPSGWCRSGHTHPPGLRTAGEGRSSGHGGSRCSSRVTVPQHRDSHWPESPQQCAPVRVGLTA